MPQRYCDPQKKLEQIAYALRKTHPKLVATDFKFKGIVLNLAYKTRGTINNKYGELKTNPLETNTESSGTTEEILFNNNSLFI